MAEIESFVVDKVQAVQVTDDGKYALYRITSDPHTLNLAIPVDQLAALVSLSSQAYAAASRKVQSDPDLKHVFSCEWWSFALAPDGQNMVLSFRLPEGMELSFLIAIDRAPQMIETLAVISGQYTMPPDGPERH